MTLLKDYIQVRVRLRRAVKADLAENKKPKLGTVYFVAEHNNTASGPYVITKDTDLKTLNYQFEMDWLYVEETTENKNVIVELYKTE